MSRPVEIESNTGSKTLFLSRASSMNRPIAQLIYRFFLNEVTVGIGALDFSKLSRDKLEANKDLLLKAFEISDSDIVDIKLTEVIPGQLVLQSFHRENPNIAFDFEREESDGTKRLLFILLTILQKSLAGMTIFLDEFDLKLHLRPAEFLLDVIRASRGAQFVFTSHNAMLIDTDKLRREQIVFVNKLDNGNSEFVPLSDYEGLSKSTDIRKAYLQGASMQYLISAIILKSSLNCLSQNEGTEIFKKRMPRRVFLVICEGDTEETYVEALKQHFRLPIAIKTKVSGNKINARLVAQYIKELGLAKDDDYPGFLYL